MSDTEVAALIARIEVLIVSIGAKCDQEQARWRAEPPRRRDVVRSLIKAVLGGRKPRSGARMSLLSAAEKAQLDEMERHWSGGDAR